ncbi:MAG TPA: YicC/YloC family endoribonuclease [Phycisphaerae bacterium]|nr:YicC/YloC family endoribonuclease [Phycisphaerae bacterium]HUT58153.1 YicC/YloC family endoribonuclease [Phycisphaerae bacterium]
MTGFGAAQGIVEGVEYAVEIRSVNSRYFKAVIKLPEYWSSAESEIDKLVRKSIQRGTVLLSVRMRLPDDQAACRVNTAALASYIAQLKVLDVDANPTLRIDLGALLALPGVCEPPAMEELCRRTQAGLMDLIGKALEELSAMRRKEGEALAAELKGHCKLIESQAAVVSDRAPQVVQDYHQRLAARVEELTNAGKVEIDSDILAREVAIFAERCDVTEELVRLQSHVGQFLAAMDSPEPAGRKMDFIAQEMLREANTMASKANDAEIGRTAVEMKAAIDRIKEQVQNVE